MRRGDRGKAWLYDFCEALKEPERIVVRHKLAGGWASIPLTGLDSRTAIEKIRGWLMTGHMPWRVR